MDKTRQHSQLAQPSKNKIKKKKPHKQKKENKK